jgi:hypothetical protein
MVEEERGGGGSDRWWKRREAVEEKIGGGGGERRCAGMGGEPTDSDTEGTVADSMEAEGGEAAKEEPVARADGMLLLALALPLAAARCR